MKQRILHLGLLTLLGVLIAVWAFFLFYSAGDRGFSESGLWQLEQNEAAAAWLEHPNHETRAFLGQEPLQGPLIGAVPAFLSRNAWSDLGPFRALRAANALFIALTALGLFVVGRRAGGTLAGLTAAVAFIAVPRIWAAGTMPGFTAPALCAITWGAIAMERARDRLVWLPVALVALVGAFATSQLAFFLIIPWVHLTFFSTDRSSARGLLASRPLTVWAPFVFPAAVILLVTFVPPFSKSGGSSLLEYSKAFMVLPREATLYFGELYSAERLPWHASIFISAVTIPPTIFFLSLIGAVTGSPITRRLRKKAIDPQHVVETRRVAWDMLLLTCFLPLLLGTVKSHGVDLLALIIPWACVFAGIGMRQVLVVIAQRLNLWLQGRRWARTGTLLMVTVLAWSVFMFAFKDVVDTYPESESYYNWFIGGVDGAAESGMPRYPHGPISPQMLTDMMGDAEHLTVAIIPEDRRTWNVLNRYRDLSLMPEGLVWAPPEIADRVLLRFDASHPSFYERFADFYAVLLHGETVVRLDVEGLPIFIGVDPND